jgi:hypothetical protein
MKLPAKVLNMLSPYADQQCLFGDAYSNEELLKRNIMAEGSIFRRLDRTSFSLTELGLKIVGKDKSKSFTEFLDVLGEMRVSFSGPEEVKCFFQNNGMDTRHNGIFEMYISGYSDMLCDYVIRCKTETTEEQFLWVYAYHKGIIPPAPKRCKH